LGTRGEKEPTSNKWAKWREKNKLQWVRNLAIKEGQRTCTDSRAIWGGKKFGPT